HPRVRTDDSHPEPQAGAQRRFARQREGDAQVAVRRVTLCPGGSMIRSTVLAALAAIIALPSLAGGQSTPREIGRISGAADDPRAELVRASWPILTDDGRFVVVNLDPLEVRVYDRRGQFQRALGREGEGPGEYRASVSLVAWP